MQLIHLLRWTQPTRCCHHRMQRLAYMLPQKMNIEESKWCFRRTNPISSNQPCWYPLCRWNSQEIPSRSQSCKLASMQGRWASWLQAQLLTIVYLQRTQFVAALASFHRYFGYLTWRKNIIALLLTQTKIESWFRRQSMTFAHLQHCSRASFL